MAKVVFPTTVLVGVWIVIMVIISAASAFEFRVGGERGWMEPTGQESEIYKHWAERNRFHIGDCLYFKYSHDSVLMVDREDYNNCNTTNPIHTFTDGNTTFWFDRYGYFYFISGEPGHCESDQKLIVRVMVHPFVNPAGPGSAPLPLPGGGGSGSGSGYWAGPSGAPTASAAWKATGGSYANVLAGLGFGFVVLMFI